MNKADKPAFRMVLIVAAVVAIVMAARWMGPRDRIPWRTNLPAAQQEAAQTDKLLLVDLTATWCGPCQRMTRTTWSDKQVAAELEKYVPVKIDVDQQPDIANRYDVPRTGIPLLLLMTPQGDILRSYNEYADSEQFLRWLSAPTITRKTGG